MTERSPALRTLAAAGRNFREAQQRRDEYRNQLFVALRAADAEGGHTRNELIRVAGVARQTVYDALRPQPATDAQQ